MTGSGRTDAGVHAMGQVCHFDLEKKKWEPHKLRGGLNAMLPAEIRVLEILSVPDKFHAQKSALRKQYSYYVGIGETPLPHLRSYYHWIKPPLVDVESLNESLRFLLGEHDFGVFQARDSSVKSTLRTLYQAQAEILAPHAPEIFINNNSILRIKLVGSGFLKQMVRSIAGTLIQISQKRFPADHFQKLLESQDRARVGVTAPGNGLWLERVWYQDLSFPSLTAPRPSV